MSKEIKVGNKIILSDRKRDLAMNRIGGLEVEVLDIKTSWDEFKTAKVKILATGTITNIVL